MKGQRKSKLNYKIEGVVKSEIIRFNRTIYKGVDGRK